MRLFQEAQAHAKIFPSATRPQPIIGMHPAIYTSQERMNKKQQSPLLLL